LIWKKINAAQLSICIQNKHSINRGSTHWSIFFQAFPTMELPMFDLSFGTNDAVNVQVATFSLFKIVSDWW
jgi:hypothetical protein